MASGTRAPSTIVTVSLNGQTDFNIPFEYLARKFVVVTLLGIDRQVLTLNTDYRFVSKTVISLANPTPAGYTQLELRRETSATERLVDFHDGSILRAYDLNLSQIQTLHVAEEARDLTADTIGVNDEGNLDARNRRIVNLADAVNGRDAINLGQVINWNDSAYNSAIKAESMANEATRQAQHAEVMANESARHATNASNDATAAQASAQYSEHHGVISQQAATLSQQAATRAETARDEVEGASDFCTAEADRAKTEADRAKTEADKLANLNGFAGSLESVTADEVKFNRPVAAHGSIYAQTGAGERPAVGLWRGGVQEFGMSIDAAGVCIVGGGNQQDPVPWTQWSRVNDWMTNIMNADFLKNVSVKGGLDVTGAIDAQSPIRSAAELVAGHGSDSRVESSSWGNSAVGNWACQTKWFWHNGGFEIGVVRGAGYDSTGLMRMFDGASGISQDLRFEPQNNRWRFLQHGSDALILYGDGNMWMKWAGTTLHEVLGGKKPVRRTTHVLLGSVPRQNGHAIILPQSVLGYDGFWTGSNNGYSVRHQFQWPSTDCVFELQNGTSHSLWNLTGGGTMLTLLAHWYPPDDQWNFYLDL